LRVVLQRVRRASVTADGQTIASIGSGLLLLVGVAEGDNQATARRLAVKCAELRIFPDDDGRLDRSVVEAGGDALVVSQFTLLADVRRGRRPSFTRAAAPAVAVPLLDAFVAELRACGLSVATGRFGADMQVELVNDGPVTVVVDSGELEQPRRG
jgi:D-tyrosyl-tRNA(Tyr) deacylase